MSMSGTFRQIKRGDKWRTSELHDVWEEVPPGTKSFEIRIDIRVVRAERYWTTSTVYLVGDGDRFYVQHNEPGSGRMTFYGPFEGDPTPLIKGTAP